MSKQTDALVIAVSQRRDVVSLYVDGAKYILEEIPAVLAKANQALATLDKYRSRLDQVSTRLTALEFEGGVTLHDVLTVLQRAELVTRMAVEIERYIVELGTEGRLIEMQLEETMVGVAADKAALLHDYLAEPRDDAFAVALDGIARLAAPGPARLRAAGRAARLRPQGQHARLSRLAARLPHPGPHPAAAEARGAEHRARVPRARRDPRRDRPRAGVGRRRGGDPREGHPRGPSPVAGDQPRGPLPADMTIRSSGTRTDPDEGGHHPRDHTEHESRTSRSTARPSASTSRSATTWSIPHHGAGQVVKKEEKNILGEVRQYLTIKILHNDMTVMVPCENAGKAGLRRVIDEETVKKVLAVLSDDVSEMPKNWNRRFKHNRDKIKTGDIYELAEVVRNLAIREQDKGLSTGEKQMYTRAKKILASELMYALDKTEDEAEAYLDEILPRSRSWRPPASAPAPTHDPRHAADGVRRQARRDRRRAGSGERLGAGRPKAFVALGGPPDARVVARRARARRGRRAPSSPSRRHGAAAARAPQGLPLGALVEGGATRSASVRNALAAAGDADAVVVHDAARPLVTPELFERDAGRARRRRRGDRRRAA